MSYADQDAQDNNTRRIAIYIGAALLAAAGGFWWWMSRGPAPAEVATVFTAPTETAATAATDPPAIKHPLEPAPAEPATTASPVPIDPDALAGTVLGEVFDGKLTEWLIPDQLVRRLVATVDNLPRDARIEPRRPLRPPSTPFAVKREVTEAVTGTERITLAPANFARYDAVVALLARTDTEKAVAGYRRLYPQLQKAYEDLGYPNGYLNDRVVEVIDHLLETPEPTGPLLLEQPKVLYRFADDDLESRSAGQKLLLRMGVDHARVVKEKLRAVRALIVGKE
jgi:hypothetical protein